jgi:hypothetical protein
MTQALSASCWFLACRTLQPRIWRLTFDGLHGVIPQTIEVFITTAVRTSNHTSVSSAFVSGMFRIRMSGLFLRIVVSLLTFASQDSLYFVFEIKFVDYICSSVILYSSCLSLWCISFCHFVMSL